jgi:hypothetical protein
MPGQSISSGIGSARRRLLLPVVFALSWSWVGAAGPVPGVVAAITPATVPEYTVKASYLRQFSRYVEWPPAKFADASTPIVIGVLGANPFNEVLEQTVRGQSSQDRPVVIRLVGTVEEAAACHIVFISRQEARQQPAWLARLRDLPVLTVAETEDALAQGAVIAFVMESGARGAKVRFDASLPAMQRAGLHISSPMLVSARQVQRGKKEGD